jgi:uncharacterized protein YdhG (YjbR/CyaY superfamily)
MVTDYFAEVPKPARAALEKLRRDIKSAAPEAVELIAWGMPAFRQDGLLVGYAAFKDHCSFFPMSGTLVRRYAAPLKGYSTSKGTIRFTPDKPLPAGLVRRLVKARIAENKTRQAARQQRAKRSKNA